MVLRLILFCRRFRWVELQVDSLCDPEYIHCAEDVEEALYSLPETLQAIYESLQTFSHYRVMGKAIIEDALKLLLCAERTLYTEELLEAVSQNQRGHTMNLDAVDIVKMSRNLVVLDQSTMILRFAHLSVREFLETHPDYRRNVAVISGPNMYYSLIKNDAIFKFNSVQRLGQLNEINTSGGTNRAIRRLLYLLLGSSLPKSWLTKKFWPAHGSPEKIFVEC